MILRTPFLPFDVNITKLYRSNFTKNDRNYNKVFCIGRPKTGTTSLEKFLKQVGFRLGNQAVGEVLGMDWIKNKDAHRIIQFCIAAEAFQDFPFSSNNLYEELDKAFPGSKFILTVRNNEDEWFDSLVRFHTRLFSSDARRPPSIVDLQNASYLYKGFIYEGYYAQYGQFGIEPYSPSEYKAHYLRSNQEKRHYFEGRTNDFIEINLSNPGDIDRLCSFLQIDTSRTSFPHENRSK